MTTTAVKNRVEKMIQVNAILTEVADEIINEWRNGDASSEQVAAIADVIDRLEKMTF